MGSEMCIRDRWNGEYFVADLDDFAGKSLFEDTSHFEWPNYSPHITKIVRLPKEGVYFPLRNRYQRDNCTLEGRDELAQKHEPGGLEDGYTGDDEPEIVNQMTVVRGKTWPTKKTRPISSEMMMRSLKARSEYRYLLRLLPRKSTLAPRTSQDIAKIGMINLMLSINMALDGSEIGPDNKGQGQAWPTLAGGTAQAVLNIVVLGKKTPTLRPQWFGKAS